MVCIEGFILAGGASKRMGRDKARLRFRDKTFIEHATDALGEITNGKISIVGSLQFDNSEINHFSSEIKKLPVISDIKVKKSPAALVGLHSALAHAESDWIIVVACDLPFASKELFKHLAAFTGDENFDAVVPLQPDGRAQPLCAFYKRASCLPQIEELLRGEDLSLRNLLDRINTRFVEFSDFARLPNSDLFFLNINTPEDYRAAQQIPRS